MIAEEDKSKFEQLYLEYRQLMFYIANQILKDEKLAEDAVHNAFVKLINYIDRIDSINCHRTKGFLVIIVRSISINLYNERKKDNYISLDDLNYSIIDDNTNIEDEVILSIEYNDLVDEILILPEIYSNVLYLKYIYELTNKEISEILNITEANVRKRLERGRKSLLMAVRREESINGW